MIRALILAALAWFALGAAPQNVSDQAKQPEAKAQGNVQAGAAEAPPPAQPPKEAEDPNPPCKQGEDNRRSDLCAQWKAADAANLAARVALWVGIGGLLVGALTLAAAVAAALFARKAALETEKGAQAAMAAVEATKEANEITRSAQIAEQLTAKMASLDAQSEREEADKRAAAAYAIAKRTADAAAAQVEVVQDTARHELRAYIGVKHIGLIGHSLASGGLDPARNELYVNVKNYGKTPARVAFAADAQYGGTQPRPRSVAKPGGSFQILQPGRIIRKRFPVKEIKGGTERRFYAIVRIFYIDIYGIGHGHRVDYATPKSPTGSRLLECINEQETDHPPPPGEGEAAD
jgi:hypothetical protein